MNKILIGICVFIISAVYAEKKVRIVSLTPCLTELVLHLGYEDSMVGRSSACDFPIRVKKIPIAGAFGVPNLEQLVLLKPNIVVSSTLRDKGVIQSIENLGIKFYLMKMESFDDYYKIVNILGEILKCQTKAIEEIKRIKVGLTKFKNDKKGKKKVYLEIWDRPYMTIGNKSFINDLIFYAGGENIANNLDKEYFNCSVEWIIKSNPDIIICPAMKTNRVADILSRKGWQNISAVKNKRIVTNIDDDLIYRLGPRVLDGINHLKEKINGF